jgi:hypothetical protein
MNLLLQHWSGPLEPLHQRSVEAMRGYAERMGADYRHLTGKPWDERLQPYCQKLIMLSPLWDRYEVVVMVDIDQFPRAGLAENIFNETGYGWHQERAQQRVCGLMPALTDPKRPFWGGAVYRLSKDLRQSLRAVYRYEDARRFDEDGQRGGNDEGIMHRLACLAQVPMEGAYFDKRWCWDSYHPDPGAGCFIHIRKKPTGDKWANYQELVRRGILS